MQKILFPVLFLFFVFVVAFSCTKNSADLLEKKDRCSATSIYVTATSVNATSGNSNGSIIATATGGNSFTYSLNGGAFQSTGTFINLAPGTYTIVAKTSEGCTGSAQFTVGTTNSCGGVTIAINPSVTTATPCTSPANGSISISATGSTGFTYSLNGGAFQSSNVFNSLTAGNYTITVKDATGCIQNAVATINVTSPGLLFSAVKNIVQTNCALSGCHLGANAQNNIDFSDPCQIVAQAQRIKIRAVDGNPTIMPPAGHTPLSASDKQKIVDWVTAGGGYGN